MSSFINKKAKSTKEVLSNMAIKTRRAHTQGQLCKKKCYDFVYALGGSSAVKSHHAFGGMMRCDQEQIQGLINTSREARVNADGITVTAERVLNALNNSVKSIPTDYESYAKELISACEKVEKSLEEHSKDLIEYAMRVEEMDTSLQTSFAECIIDGYKQTADGVDNRFAYMDIEYSLEELNRLEAKSESERTPEEQAKLEVLRLKAMTEGNKDVLNMVEIARKEYEAGICEIGSTNNVKYNTWYYGREVADGDRIINGIPISYAWCSVFVMWCANEAGLLDNEMLPELSEAKKAYLEGVRNVKDYYKEKGKYHENSGEGYIPQVGDFVAFKSSQGNHIGIVAGYDVETDTLYTYEGNASNAVKAYYYENVPDNTYIVGYCDNSGGIINVPDNLEIFVENEKGSTR